MNARIFIDYSLIGTVDFEIADEEKRILYGILEPGDKYAEHYKKLKAICINNGFANLLDFKITMITGTLGDYYLPDGGIVLTYDLPADRFTVTAYGVRSKYIEKIKYGRLNWLTIKDSGNRTKYKLHVLFTFPLTAGILILFFSRFEIYSGIFDGIEVLADPSGISGTFSIVSAPFLILFLSLKRSLYPIWVFFLSLTLATIYLIEYFTEENLSEYGIVEFSKSPVLLVMAAYFISLSIIAIVRMKKESAD